MKTFHCLKNCVFILSLFTVLVIQSSIPCNSQAIVLDVDPTIPGIQSSFSVPITFGPFDVETYWVSPGPGVTPMFNVFGVATEWNDGTSTILTHCPPVTFDPGGAGYAVSTPAPMDFLTGGMLTAPCPPLCPPGMMASFALAPSGTVGSSGFVFMDTNGGVAVFDIVPFLGGPTLYPPPGTTIKTHADTFMPTTVGTTDITAVGIFLPGQIAAPCPAGPASPAIAVPPAPGSTFAFYDNISPPFPGAGCTGYMAIGGGAMYPCPVCPGIVTVTAVVAAELGTLKAETINRSTILQWETYTETDNLGFEILNLQPVGGDLPVEDWFPIDFVAGVGQSSSMNVYDYLIEDLSDGTHYFKLKQMNEDESFTYSNVVKVDIKNNKAFSIGNIYPNPVFREGKIPIYLSSDQQVTIDLINFNGQRVQQLYNGTLAKKISHEIGFDTNELSSGIYFLAISGQNFSKTSKIIVAN